MLGQGCLKALFGKQLPPPFKLGNKWVFFVNLPKWVQSG